MFSLFYSLQSGELDYLMVPPFPLQAKFKPSKGIRL